MLIRKEEQEVTYLPHLQGGEGAPKRRIFLPKEEAAGTGRLFSVFTLQPGESIGYHSHTDEFEFYYILKGEGTVTEDGVSYFVREGDMMQCKNGSAHSILNTGEEPLEFVAVILYVKE